MLFQAPSINISILREILISFLIFILIIILGYLVGKYLKKRLLALAKKTRTKADDVFVEKAYPLINWIFFVVAARVAIGYVFNFTSIPAFVDRIFYSIIAVLIIVLAVEIANLIISVVNEFIAKKKGIKVKNPLLPLFKSVMKATLLITGFLILLAIWGVNIAPFLGGLGIAGLAISFAVKDSLQNVFGGMALILDKTIKVGDRVQLEDGTTGVVHDMTLRSTKIRTWDNEIIIIPNGILANSRVHNIHGPDPMVRVVVPFSVAYGSDVKKVKEVILKTIRKVENCLDEPEPTVTFDSMGDFSLNFSAKFWVASPELRYNASLQAREMIYEALNKHNITIPFPTHTVYLNEERKREKKKSKKNGNNRKKKK